MSNRIVLFASAKDFEKFFGMQVGDEPGISPNYNIAPGQEVSIVTGHKGNIHLERAIWGLSAAEPGEPAGDHVIGMDEALTGLGERRFSRCIIPVSGYYKWKSNGKRAEYPFFIRMLDDPIMALAGVAFMENGAEEGRNAAVSACSILQTESNALIQPLDPLMPLQFSRELAIQWLTGGNGDREILEEARKLFLMTEMTVLRVSKKVNDLSNNTPDLIQPLPK